MKAKLVSVCENMHITEAEIIDPEINGNGKIIGYCGSSADFCDVCGSDEMMPLDVRVYES